jgi:hypothetical protein
MISSLGRADSISLALVASLGLALGVGCRAGEGGGAGGAGGSVSTGKAGTGGTAPAGTGGSGSGAAGIGSTGISGGAGTNGSAGTTGSAGATGAGGTTGSAGMIGHAGAGGGSGTAGRGGTGGAGTTGSAGTGGGGAGNPCSARPGLIFCDTFEAATTTTPPSPWTTTGTVTVDSTTPAHSGKKSIHIGDTANDYDTLLILYSASVLPVTAGRFYVRVFMQLHDAMSAGHNTFILSDLFAAQGSGNALRVGEQNQMLMFTLMGDAHGALSNANYYNDGKPGIQFTPGAWTCLEILLDSKKPEIDVWVDTHEVPDLHHTDFPIDNYDNLRFGFEKYAGPAVDIWYDDIAVGTQPIGCD